jgi:hypothetical protein
MSENKRNYEVGRGKPQVQARPQKGGGRIGLQHSEGVICPRSAGMTERAERPG